MEGSIVRYSFLLLFYIDMKTLVQYIQEELAGATPANTMGMGNPQPPGLSPTPGDVEGSVPGSWDLLTIKKKKKKNK